MRNYDGMGRQTSTVTNGVTTTSTFDAYGKPLTQSMPHSTGAWHYTTTEYDSMGRAISVTAPDGSATTYSYNGLTTSVTDANDHSTTTVANILGQTLSVTPPAGPGVAFTYDPLGNLLTATRGGASTALTYDKAGRKTSMNDADMGEWDYSYDALGNLTSQTDSRNCTTALAYDVLNRVTGKSYSNCPTTTAVTYTYDVGTYGKGRRTSMGISGADFTSWTYDERGRVVTEAKQITGGGQFVTSFTYNSADLPVTMTYPDGEVLDYEYNNDMRLTSVAGLADYVQSIAYDSAGRMTQMTRGNGILTTTYAYFNWNQQGGRLQQLATVRPSNQTTLQNFTYSYDSVGNIMTINDSLSGPQTQNFTYDALDRLVSANATGGTNGLYNESYSYNATTGNLSSKAGVNYTYSTTHKHAVANLSNGNSYSYDDNGNMTTRNVGGQTYTLAYDAENRLVSVSGAATANYVYDGDGKQIKSVVNGVTTYYVGNHYEVKSSLVTKYYFASSTRVAVRKDGTLSYLLGDHLGSSSVTTNASGAKTASLMYKAWGEPRHSTGTMPTDYRYTGQREESAIGLHYYGARWYDSSLSRFVQADTIIPQQTQGTQSWDRYAYTNNNPVRYTDPSGHFVPLFLAAAIVGGVLLGTSIYTHFIHQPSRPADGNASNVWELAYLGYEHADHANIVGEGLQSLQNQKSLQGEQGNLIDQIRDDPRYSVEAFAHDKISADFTANGPSGKWYQAPFDGGQAFWMTHGGRISATNVNVSEDGTISLTWKVSDQFDYIPRWDKGIFHPYNLFAVPMHFLYNEIGGAIEQFPTNAYWDETIPPPPYSCGQCE